MSHYYSPHRCGQAVDPILVSNAVAESCLPYETARAELYWGPVTAWLHDARIDIGTRDVQSFPKLSLFLQQEVVRSDYLHSRQKTFLPPNLHKTQEICCKNEEREIAPLYSPLPGLPFRCGPTLRATFCPAMISAGYTCRLPADNPRWCRMTVLGGLAVDPGK